MSQADEPAGIQVGPVSGWLTRAGVGAVAPFSFARMGDGRSNLTYLVTDARQQRWVLRRAPTGPRLASAHDIAREHRVMSALAGTAVLAPTPLALCEDADVAEVPLLLMQLVEGLVVESRAVALTLAEGRRRAIGRSLAEALGTVHAVDVAAVGLTGLASDGPYAHRQLRRWRRQWDDTGLRELPGVHALADRLERCVPPQRETTLVHGDYHLLNVVTSTSDGGVAGILDWELCTLGDPVADLGGLLAYWPESDDEAGAPTDIPSLPGFPTRSELVERYAETTGRDVSSVGYWFALACWKLVVVAEGVRSRALTDASGDTRISAQTVEVMLGRAEQVADEHGLPG